MVETVIVTEIDIVELALKSRPRDRRPSYPVTLVKIDQVLDIGRHLQRLGDVEGDDQIDRDLLRAEIARELNRRIGAERMADQDDVAGVAAPVAGSDLVGRDAPLLPTENDRLISA